ncbi:MAG TPA: thioesterase family protein [Stellaceae bacterium]|nr:thioesterase family protein [Stellaceae bacterium]
MNDSGAQALPSPTERGSYAIWTYDKLRYADTDRQGHVNNAVFATFCESGRVMFLYDEKLNLAGPDANFVVVRLELDFRSELFYPGRVDIGTRVLGIGRTSFRLGQGIFNGETCAATAETVLVQMDAATRKAKALTPQLRAWLEERLAKPLSG